MFAKVACIASLILVFVLALGSASWAQPAHPAACSNATLSGNSGFTITGTDASGPTVAGGQITADGNGHFTGTVTSSEDGTVTDLADAKGTYAIKANCTGKGAITPKGGSTSHFTFTVVSRGTELELVVTDSGTVQLGLVQAQGTATCSTKGVQGTYGLQATGTLVGLGQIALNGQVKLHQGVISGTVSGSVGGQTFTGEKLDGGYKVASNCQGGAVVSANQEMLHLTLIVVNDGKEILFIDEDTGTVISGSLQQ